MTRIIIFLMLVLVGCAQMRVTDPTVACSPAIGGYRHRAVVYGEFAPYHTALQQVVSRGCVGRDVALQYEFSVRQERMEFIDWRGRKYPLRREGWDESALTAAYGQWLRETAGASRTEWGPNGSYTKEDHFRRCDSEGRCSWNNGRTTSNKEGPTGTK